MKKYKKFTITAEPFNSELLSGLLWEFDIKGISEEENSLLAFADSVSNISASFIKERLKKLQTEKLIVSYNVEESVLEEKNWNEEWERSLNVIMINERIVIKPSFKDYKKKNDEIIITIDPKMSFGTGEHPTTKLIIQLLEKYIRHGMKILDVGTGTGILSITALKLGALSAIGFDTDEWCCENAKENCNLNSVSEKIEIRLGDISIIPESDFNMIVANMQKNILMELSGELTKKLTNYGLILLSGLLEGDEKEISSEYSDKGLECVETIQMDEWIAMALIKR